MQLSTLSRRHLCLQGFVHRRTLGQRDKFRPLLKSRPKKPVIKVWQPVRRVLLIHAWLCSECHQRVWGRFDERGLDERWETMERCVQHAIYRGDAKVHATLQTEFPQLVHRDYTTFLHLAHQGNPERFVLRRLYAGTEACRATSEEQTSGGAKN